MALFVVSSVGRSQESTSWSLLLAACWPGELGVERAVLEADPDGGVLGARYGLGVEPGVAGLVSAARHDELPVAECGRLVLPDVWVVPGPESSEGAWRVWRSGSSAASVAGLAAGDGRVWLADCGRLSPASCVLPFAASASVTVVVCGAAHEELVQVPARVSALHRLGASVGVLVVGKHSYVPDELSEFFGTGLVWSVPADRDLHATTGAVLGAKRGWLFNMWRSSSGVLSAARLVARDLAARGASASGLDQAVEL
jgi:hypothetical protein